jgi:dTDP-4-amino-4,6-dideoxygalactose transaminase
MEKLAIDGGKPIRSKNPIVETDYFTDEELNSVVDVMKSARIRRGSLTLEYERLIAEKLNVKHALAVTSGTTTLHIAMAALGIGPGDEVIVTPYTFIASDTCVLEQNAIPIFADIDPITLTLDPADV